MAGRPIEKRTAKSYQREIETLGRLRTAIQIDLDLDWAKVERALKCIDDLIDALLPLIEADETRERQSVG